MTERLVANSSSVPWDIDAVGTCGGIQPCNDAKVVDVPEMGVSIHVL
jgi:long-chain acyl-CoA synthetase